MKRETLKEEKVYSTVQDNNFAKNISDSPVWKNCLHSSEVSKDFYGYVYTVLFDGLKPVQLTNTRKI